MNGPAAIKQCERTDSLGRQCALVDGHGVAFHGHTNGVVVDGHLYPSAAGEDLSAEIRTQLRLDELATLRASLDETRSEVDRLTRCLASETEQHDRTTRIYGETHAKLCREQEAHDETRAVLREAAAFAGVVGLSCDDFDRYFPEASRVFETEHEAGDFESPWRRMARDILARIDEVLAGEVRGGQTPTVGDVCDIATMLREAFDHGRTWIEVAEKAVMLGARAGRLGR